MTCPKCQHETVKKFGTTGKAKIQRYRCKDCGATFSPRPVSPLDQHRISLESACHALTLILEGASIRATSRITGIHKNTLLRLLLTAGLKCRFVMNKHVRNVQTRFVQADELWGFVAKKQKRVTIADNQARKGAGGSVALDCARFRYESGLVVSRW